MMAESRFSDPYTCINCGKQIADDGDAQWINEEPPGHLYPGYAGDPVCVECFGAGPSAAFELDRTDEL